MSFMQTAGIALREGRDLDRQANADYRAEMETANVEDERKIRAILGKLAMEFDRVKAEEEAAKKAASAAPAGAPTDTGVNMVSELTDGSSQGGALGRATSTAIPGATPDFTTQRGYANGGRVSEPFRGVFDAQKWDNDITTRPSIYRDTIKDGMGVDPRDPDFETKAKRNAEAVQFMQQKQQEKAMQMQSQQRVQPQRPVPEFSPAPDPIARFANGGYIRTRGVATAKGYANGGPVMQQGALGNMALYPGFADGGEIINNETGEIEGPGTGTSDSIPAYVSDGEYIIPADVVEAKGVEFFDKIVEKYHTPVVEGER
jgi:hypothetical protein